MWNCSYQEMIKKWSGLKNTVPVKLQVMRTQTVLLYYCPVVQVV